VKKQLLAEGLGGLLLSAAVIGSGIMGERLAGGNTAVALLANTGATVGALAVLIAVFGPISGAHFNPVITLAAAARRELHAVQVLAYITVQVAGCCLGAVLANAMFELPLVESSLHHRVGFAQWLGEIVATGGLVLVALGSPSFKEAAWRVAAWIGAAYWFTSSTSFANPAITIGRSLSDTFAGIHPADVPAFIAAQLIGGTIGFLLVRFLLPGRSAEAGAHQAHG
jgi:glycerol uptake facilitator-like aquaporin